MQFELLPPKWTFNGLVTIHPDGRVELGEGVTTEMAAQGFWDAMKRCGLDLRRNALEEAAKLCDDNAAAWAEEARAAKERDADPALYEAQQHEASALAFAIREHGPATESDKVST